MARTGWFPAPAEEKYVNEETLGCWNETFYKHLDYNTGSCRAACKERKTRVQLIV